MAKPARRRESIHLDAIYRYHPLFAGVEHEVWSDGFGGHADLEGGDILVIGNGCVLIGMGERTRAAAVELYASRLFAASAANRVIAVVLPAERSSMHLDTVMTMIDRDAFTIYSRIQDSLASLACARRQPGSASSARTTCSRRSPTPSSCRACDCSRPAVTTTSPSASNGTTATTCWRSRRASSSPTSATSTRTRACATRGSR